MIRKMAELLLAFGMFTLIVVSGQQSARARDKQLGLFQGDSDVGAVTHPGAVKYDAEGKTYTVSGSGENIWDASDAFHVAWKKVAGDLRLTADISFQSRSNSGHRKAVLMIRQSLDADAAYADVALEGDGSTSLQYRNEKGGATHEIQTTALSPEW